MSSDEEIIVEEDPVEVPHEVEPTARVEKSTGLHRGEPAPGVAKVDPILVADNISRAFGGVKAVDVEHLEVPRHAITALIGPNGAGKTTLFKMLAGDVPPSAGTVELFGRDVTTTSTARRARMGVGRRSRCPTSSRR